MSNAQPTPDKSDVRHLKALFQQILETSFFKIEKDLLKMRDPPRTADKYRFVSDICLQLKMNSWTRLTWVRSLSDEIWKSRAATVAAVFTGTC